MTSDQFRMHLDDSAILRLLDDDSSSADLTAWTRHLRECDPCAASLRQRRHESEIVRSAISELQLPAGFPDADALIAATSPGGNARANSAIALQRWWFRRPALAIAAAVMVLLLSLALYSPVRAALVGLIRQIQTAGFSDQPTVDLPQPVGEIDSGYTLRFTPAGREVRILVDAHQSAGDITVTRSDGSEALLDVSAGGGEALITGSVVRIRGNAGSRSDYRLAVPAGVDQVIVQVAGEPARALLGGELDEGSRIGLQ